MAKKEPTTKTARKPRVRKAPRYTSFRLSKRIQHSGTPVPGAFRLFFSALGFIKRHWRILGGILLIYALLMLVLVRGFGSSLDFAESQYTLGVLENLKGVQLGTRLFGELLTTSTTSSEVSGLYQSMLIVIMSLVIIWTVRQLQAGATVSIKEAFYKSTYPLVPFLIVLVVIGLQLLPALLGTLLFNIVMGGLAATAVEQFLWLVIIFLLMVLSLYMISSSIFALYIVTLPNVAPLQALRSARQLVLHRRWQLMRKVIILPILLFSILAVVMIPTIIVAAGIAEWVFFGLNITMLAIAHTYLYNLYRALL